MGSVTFPPLGKAFPRGNGPFPLAYEENGGGNGAFPSLPFLERVGNASLGAGNVPFPGWSVPFTLGNGTPEAGNEAFPGPFVDTGPLLLLPSLSLGGRQEGTTLGP